MKVINLLPEHINMLSNASQAESIDIDRVQKCYEQHQDVFNHLRNEILIQKEICLTAVQEIGVAELHHHIKVFNLRIEERLSRVLDKLSQSFDISKLNNDIYITIGNNRTNAIVTWHRYGTLFLFAEKIDLDYFEIIATHEITHLVQREIYSDVEAVLLIDLFFAEGVACYFSKVINPGYLNSEYICFKKECGEDMHLDFIQSRCTEIEDDFNRNEPVIFEKCLSGSFSLNGWITRIGYFIGLSVVEEISNTMTDEMILGLDLMELRRVFRETFQRLFNIAQLRV